MFTKVPFSLMMAGKYLKPQRSLVSVVTVISMIGVMLGVAVLIIVLSVMTGFDGVWRDRILGFNSHINLLPESSYISSWEAICDQTELTDGVLSASPLVDGIVLMQNNDLIQTPLLRGVDPSREKKAKIISNKIIAGEYSLNFNEVILGSGLARRLDVHVGDDLLTTSPKALFCKDEIQLPQELKVSGIFHLGMYEYDEGFAYTSLSTADSLYAGNGSITSIQVMLYNPMDALNVGSRLSNNIQNNWYVQTWMEAHQQIFTALQVEKNMMFFLLAFVALVAAFSITNTLITLTVQKTHEIGLLKALGFPNHSIIGIFLWMGLIQGIIGTSLGIGLALVVLKYRNELLNFMSSEWNINLLPPELYQLSQLPSQTTFHDVSIVASLVIIFCIIAGIVPAWRSVKLSPVNALRFE